MEQGLNAVAYYDPPNMTFPFGAYLCVVDVDKYTGETNYEQPMHTDRNHSWLPAPSGPPF